MINEKIVENIRQYGTYKDSGEGRHKVLVEDIGFQESGVRNQEILNSDYCLLLGGYKTHL